MLIDLYALAPMRSSAVIDRFLARYMPDREVCDTEYTVRVGDDEQVFLFDTPEKMATFCEASLRAEGRAYWRNRHGGDPHSAHVFFLPDGGLVFGISVTASDRAAWDRWLTDLKAFIGADHGYWICETPPAGSIAEFADIASRYAEPR